jgi:tetratricopeptide (TPR) repeat protein
MRYRSEIVPARDSVSRFADCLAADEGTSKAGISFGMSDILKCATIPKWFRRGIAGIGTLLALLASLGMGQTSVPRSPLAIEGTVRDSAGHPVAGATVSIQAKDGSQHIGSTETTSDGTYSLTAPQAGAYLVKAAKAGFTEAVVGPVELPLNDSSKVDLKLEGPANESSNSTPNASSWNLSDRPDFTVAGIADATNPAGYGSDARVRTSQSLSKDAVSLRDQPASGASSATGERSTQGFAATEKQLRASLQQSPHSFDANRGLGELYARAGRPAEAIPFLEEAYRVEPGQYANAFELAQAYASTAQYEKARDLIQTLLARADKAELHHLMGEVEEGRGDPLAAVREYERAARLEPSEPNLFDWGAELLLHRTLEPAVEVFTEGNRLFPKSTRMLVGLGATLYARGSYADAVRRMCEASDLDPSDSTPYVFMGRMLNVAPAEAADVRARLSRFVRLQPQNARANYYYALSLLQQDKGSNGPDLEAESLFKKAVELDPKFGEAYLQLGILYADRKRMDEAIGAYQKAIEATPDLAEAHYRLGQAYAHTGEKLKAQQELALYEQVVKEQAAEAEKQQREIRQFVYTSKDRSPGARPE